MATATTRIEHKAAFTAPAEFREALERLATPLGRARGAVLFRQGQPGEGIYLLQRGKARLFLPSHDGQPLAPRLVGPGAVLGLPSTICSRPYSLTAEIVEDAKVGFVPADKVLDFLRSNVQICFQVVLMLGDEVREMRNLMGRPEKKPS